MKTSNKILLSAVSVLGLSLLSILIFAKSSLINVEENTIKGDGKIVKMNYDVDDFTALKVDGKFEVYLRKGSPELVIEADENIQAFLRTNYDQTVYNVDGKRTSKKRLRVKGFENIIFNPTKAIKLFLAVPSLEGVELGSHASISFADTMSSDQFRIVGKEFSKFDLKLNTEDLKIDTRNHCDITVNGTIGNTEVSVLEFSNVNLNNLEAEEVILDLGNHSTTNIQGTTNNLNIQCLEFAKVYAQDLIAQEAYVQATSHADIAVNVTQNLNVNANEFSHVKYRGTPNITKVIAKSGSLSAME